MRSRPRVNGRDLRQGSVAGVQAGKFPRIGFIVENGTAGTGVQVNESTARFAVWKAILLFACISSGPALAQSIPNFAGVYLEVQVEQHVQKQTSTRILRSPLVLEIEQNASAIRLREWQNGSQAIYLYNLNGEPTTNDRPGKPPTRDRITFDIGKLVLRSEVQGPGFIGEIQREAWTLSPDLQTLTVEPAMVDRLDVFPVETYARQPSLQAAMENAAKVSSPNICPAAQSDSARDKRETIAGIPLGATTFEQLGWTAAFQAQVTGDFFTNLRRVSNRSRVQFRRKKELVSKYSGTLTLSVRPTMRREPHRVASSTPEVTGGWRFENALRGLRFHVQWVGPEPRDLGELPAELRTSSAANGTPLEGLFEIRVPADHVPITDTLQVHILSWAGVQLGCVSGHL
jgi:hypothetical protein